MCLALFPAAAPAQTARQPEVRVDILGPTPFSLQPGVGANVALGYYARLGASIGYAVRADSNELANRWRGDLIGRFVFDPFRQQWWGLSLGAGLSVRRHLYIAAVADLEGPEMAGWLPALQLGVSGGFRAGVVVRRAMAGRR